MGNTINFKGQVVVLEEDPKIGVCNYCRRIVPFDCSRTHIHHVEYHDDDPLRNTIESCPACHGVEHRVARFGKVMFLCIPKPLLARSKKKAYKKFGPKKGYLSKAGEEAFRMWLKDGKGT